MDTRAEIIKIADGFIREKSYHAFSFSDISQQINIRNASIHYHFPSKTDLGIAIIRDHQEKLAKLIEQSEAKNALEKMQSFLTIYSAARKDNQICLVGSLVTDFYTVDSRIQSELKKLAGHILLWVTQILEEGKADGLFHFTLPPRTKALMVITNMLAAVQLTRLTNTHDFERIKQTVLKDLTSKNQ
jgi:TetR/AcrR family transcriptional regulator, transcriptional repressor for nem operon